MAVEPVDAAPTPPVTAAPTAVPKLALELTPEIEAAVVCVRVAVASTIQRDHAGVILSPQEFHPPVSADTERRFAAVLLPAYEEEALRDPNCVFYVLRNKVDSVGVKRSTQFQATLVHFDASTQVAVVQFTEKFAYKLDTGLQTGTSSEQLHILQASYSGQLVSAPAASTPQAPMMQPPSRGGRPSRMPLQPGNPYPGQSPAVQPITTRLKSARLGGTTLTTSDLSETDPSNLNSAAVLTDAGKLAGFASRISGNSWQFHSFTLPSVEVKSPSYIPESIELVRKGDREFSVTLKGKLQDPLNELKNCQIAMHKVTDAEASAFTPATNPGEDQPPVQADDIPRAYKMSSDGIVTFPLWLPSGFQTANCLVQVHLMKDYHKALFHSSPVLITSKARGAGIYQKVLGAVVKDESSQEVAASAATQDSSLKEVTTESRILYGIPICEGREVLLKLEQAPFWKRLSLSSGQWLPLPPDDLSAVSLAGNKDAIFVMNSGSREIKRYDAASLKLEKTEQLPAGAAFHDIAAGCLSANSPVALICKEGIATFDPHDLIANSHGFTSKSATSGNDISDKIHFKASGDGCLLRGVKNDPKIYATLPIFKYRDDLLGFSDKLASNDYAHYKTTVSSWWEWDDEKGLRHAGALQATHEAQTKMRDDYAIGTFVNSPNFYQIRKVDYKNAPSVPPQCLLFSYYSEQAWAAIDVPEAKDVGSSDWNTFADRIWLDPYTLSLAVWHADQTITLRTLDKSKLTLPATPVLLNYPDTYVERGKDFHFTPLVFGTPNPSFRLVSSPGGFKLAPDGVMEWNAPADALPAHVDFSVELSAGQSASSVELSLQMGGQRPIAAFSSSVDSATVNTVLAQTGKGKPASTPLATLNSRLYWSDRPIASVLPGLSDYIALLLNDNTLALFSLKSWKIEGSLTLGRDSAAFMAGDTVLVYDSTTRTLTRHSLPDFGITHRFPLPRASKLIALGAGETPLGPITLVTHEMVNAKPHPSAKAGITTSQPRHALLILDKETLAAGKWPSFMPKSEIISPLMPQLLKISSQRAGPAGPELPSTLPVSADGRIISFPKGKLFVSPTFAAEFLYPSNMMADQIWTGKLGTSSMNGDRVFNSGAILMGDRSLDRISGVDPASMAMSRCGNYLALLSRENNVTTLKICSTDGNRPLLNLPDLSIFEVQDGYAPIPFSFSQLYPMGEKNVLIVLSRGGTAMQVINFDLAAAFSHAAPASAFVTSHQFPMAAQGRMIDYQITLNNPAVVNDFKLRDHIPGASIDSKGRFTYRVPSSGKGESKQINVSVLIQLKNKDVVLHEFPIFAIAIKP